MQFTGLVLTRNGERLLERCLRSLRVCDRILVVDSESDDRTREIAGDCGAEVLVRHWEGPAPQFRFALERLGRDWVMSLDQDEFLSPELEASLRELRAQAGRLETRAGFYCARRSFYYDRFIGHCGWYPDRLLRVFRADRMEVRTSGPHYSFHPLGPTGRVQGDIVHYPYAGLREHLDKINYYTQIAAAELAARGGRGGALAGLAHGLGRFCKIYLLKRGFLDGRAGLILALHGFIYAFEKYVRVAELHLPAATKTALLDEGQSPER